ncbi:small subunit ribosomal protein S10e [Nematocida sp. AWRm80]|nr:small subunit ribosomal protein S10e [Nematocida sp. AWRm80]
MHIPTSEIKEVYNFVFSNGVVVTKDSKPLEKHDLMNVSNLKVKKVLKKLTSMGYLTREFIWNHAYHTITDKGIKGLREKLFLEETAVPSTHESMMSKVELKQEIEADAPLFHS